MSFISKLISFFLLIPALFGLYKTDDKDTQELYLENIAAVGYENDVETAIPQTDLYGMIKDHFESELPEGKTEKKAIIIGYDGGRADALILADGPFSGIKKLRDAGGSCVLAYCGGVNYPAENTQATSTAPGWCSILTGVWAEENGVYGNGQIKDLTHKTLLTSLTEDGIIDSATFITIWDGHFVDENSTYKDEKAYCEENNLPVSFNYCATNTVAAAKAIEDITQDDCSDFIFAIYEGPDGAGHGFGFSVNNPCYQVGFKLNDQEAHTTITAIENRPTYETEDWLIILTSDHGGFGTGHGGPTIQERMTFVVTNK